MKKKPIIMDCDPGTDDALALLMVAAADNIELRAITTVAGNLNKAMTSYNARKMADYFSIKVPIGEGAYPLMKNFEPLDISICGVSGLGDAVLPEPVRDIDARPSVQILYQEAVEAKGELEILATGPLTNLALLIREYPQVKELIKQIVLMGGAVTGGNITPKAEFNIYTDAEAAKIVFQSGIPITMIGLEVCYETPVYKEELGRLLARGGKAADFIAGIMYYPGNESRPFPEEGLFIYDALAAVAIIDPGAMKAKAYYVDVETKGEITYGQTVVDTCNYLKQEPNTLVTYECDKDKFLKMIEQSITYFN
jgi:pyrimidine-specific ribonucleoside hydrolase